MAYDVGAAFRRIEDELIASMIRNLDNHRAQETAEGFQWPQWQAEQLKALAEYKSRNKKLFNGKFGKINENISTAIREAHSRGQMEQEEKILNAIKRGYKSGAGSFNGSINTTGEFFKVNERKLNALINATTDDMKKAESAVLRMADDKYRKIIFDAQVYANAGGTTYEKAVDMATHDFLQAGLNCIEYKNGARHTISDYADMAIRTANKRAYLRGEAVKREEWGIHTVIVNKRGNPCPLCLPFVGQVLIDDVYGTGSKKDGDYTLLSEAMAEGFLHPRCQDAYTTYFEGISTPPEEETPTREEAKEIEENNRRNQKKQYAENQAEKLSRLSKYSLDSDNKRMYAARAEQWQKKAESVEKSVEKTGENDIIIVDGKNVQGEWKPRDGYEHLIDDIIDYQNYNGKPTIINSQKEFDEAVQKDHFLAERTIKADSEEQLKLYEDQLLCRNGQNYFYVNCGVGGAQYGQGMYCAADYTKGTIPFENFSHEIEQYGGGSPHKTIWMTVEPSSKILEIPSGEKAAEYIPNLYVREYAKKHAGARIDDVLDYIKKCEAVDDLTFRESESFIDEVYKARNDAGNKISDILKEARNSTTYVPEGSKYAKGKDVGVLAAEMGYDLINASGHGKTGSYTVVLNRTKLIIFGGDKYGYKGI